MTRLKSQEKSGSTQATVFQLDAVSSCRCGLRRRAKEHHDRLLLIDRDGEQLLELLELAVTWGELDYSNQAIIPPNRWLEFARDHDWRDAERAERIFSLANDIAMGAVRVDRGRAHALSSAFAH
jgi:hypothetical protein